MLARLKSVERAQRKLVRLTERGARERVISRQKARVEQRAFVVLERDMRIAKQERAALDAGLVPPASLPLRPTDEEYAEAARAVGKSPRRAA